MRKFLKLLKLIRVPLYRQGLRKGVAAAIEHDRLLHTEQYGSVIDVGANKGQFSLVVRRHYPEARLIAFEPLAGPAQVYDSIFGRDRNVSLRRCALGAQNQTAEIHVSARDDSSSMLPIGDRQNEVFPGTFEVGKEKIEVRKLDEEVQLERLPGPVLLKIDVQGFELETLRGAEKSLHGIDSIYVELSFVEFYSGQPLAADVIDWLSRRDFGLAGVYHIAHKSDGASVQADFLFKRSTTLLAPNS